MTTQEQARSHPPSRPVSLSLSLSLHPPLLFQCALARRTRCALLAQKNYRLGDGTWTQRFGRPRQAPGLDKPLVLALDGA
jgi:hypothetical protein